MTSMHGTWWRCSTAPVCALHRPIRCPCRENSNGRRWLASTRGTRMRAPRSNGSARRATKSTSPREAARRTLARAAEPALSIWPPGGKCRVKAGIPLLRGTFRPSAIWRSRPHAFELHVSHAGPDFAEEDLLLDPVGESDGPADFRPRPAVALRHHMDEVLRVMGLRVALVRPGVGVR